MENNLFKFNKVWKFTPISQILIICSLYVIMVIQGYYEYKATGLLQGLNMETRLFLVPIYEEIIFRGFILGALLKNNSIKKSIIYSSLLFGLWHLRNILVLDLESLIYQIIYTTIIFGPILAYITIKTKSIWSAVVLHYLNNIISPISLVAFGYITQMI